MIRLGQWLSLIFFVCLITKSCRQKETRIMIVWDGKQATGISIPTQLTDEESNSPLNNLQVHLKGNATAMLGNYKSMGGSIVFTPLIPLSPGAGYEMFYKNKLIGTVQIPAANAANAAYIINVFPAVDTLPENLLKIYVQFSSPMQEGRALEHIHLLNEHNDTVPDVFLDLQPELWNTKRTVLTVWLDPGRIKRELIPNQQLGNPLQSGKRYTVAISNNWKDMQSLPLRQSFIKAFVAGARDSISPQPGQWIFELPKAKTNDGLEIKFGESLDYFLLSETIQIKDEKGRIITGKGRPSSNGTGFTFWPEQPWQPSRYKLRVASYLEDLAGNNLNRLFDRDITTQKTKPDSDFVDRAFEIK